MPDPWDKIPIEKWRRLLAIAVDMHDIDPADLADDDEIFTAEDKRALDAWSDHVIGEIRSSADGIEVLPKSTVRFINDLLKKMSAANRPQAEREFEALKVKLSGRPRPE